MNRRAIFSWCLFDWANSAYPTVVVTFVFAAYFTQGVAADPEAGTAAWGSALAISALIVAVLSPIFGAIADRSGRRKPWIAVMVVVVAAASAGLWFVEPVVSAAFLALALVVIGNAGMEMGQVFYNAMLPSVAPPGKIGRVSGWAWGLGYLGGLTALGLCLVLLILPEVPPFGLDKESQEPVRATGPLIALWTIVFALPLFLFTPEGTSGGQPRLPFGEAIGAGFRQLKQSIANARRYKGVLHFLLARMLYTDGLNTLFAFGGIYAAGTFGMGVQEILVFGIILNVASGAGAFAFAWVDDWIGAKPTIVISLVCLIVIGLAVLTIDTKLWLYILGCGIGIFLGPVQSASRSLMAQMAPPQLMTEFFGLYALSGKATAFMGPFLVGWLTLWADSQRVGMAVIPAFLLVGLLLLLPLRVTKSAESAPA